MSDNGKGYGQAAQGHYSARCLHRVRMGGAVVSADGSTYYGVMIHRETSYNSAGLRWWAFCDGQRLRADTLEGIRELIRHYGHHGRQS